MLRYPRIRYRQYFLDLHRIHYTYHSYTLVTRYPIFYVTLGKTKEIYRREVDPKCFHEQFVLRFLKSSPMELNLLIIS